MIALETIPLLWDNEMAGDLVIRIKNHFDSYIRFGVFRFVIDNCVTLLEISALKFFGYVCAIFAVYLSHDRIKNLLCDRCLKIRVPVLDVLCPIVFIQAL